MTVGCGRRATPLAILGAAGPRRIVRPTQVDTWDDQAYIMTMKQIAAAKFKEQCLALLDEVGEEGIVITKRGKPVAKLIPIRAESASLIGSLKAKIRIEGDILSTGLRWDAQP